MKKVIFGLGLGILTSFAASAQKTKAKTKTKSNTSISVPADVNNSFTAMHADVEKKSWTKTVNGNYIANYQVDDMVKETAEFNVGGKLVKTKTAYSTEAVPEVVASAVTQKFTDATINECTKITMPGLAPYYKANIKLGADGRNKEILISEEGAITS